MNILSTNGDTKVLFSDEVCGVVCVCVCVCVRVFGYVYRCLFVHTCVTTTHKINHSENNKTHKDDSID